MKNMPEEEKGLSGWVKKHRKAIVITSLSVFVLSTTALAGLKIIEAQNLLTKLTRYKNYAVDGNLPTLNDGVNRAKEFILGEDPRNAMPIQVMAHARNLTNGQHASSKQIDLAVEYGCILKPNQTFVTSYEKNYA